MPAGESEGGEGEKKIRAALTEGEINAWIGTEKWGVRGHGQRRDKQKIV